MNHIIRGIVVVSLLALAACAHAPGTGKRFRIITVPFATEAHAPITKSLREGQGVRTTQPAQSHVIAFVALRH